MAKTTSRWRHFHTDELRELLAAIRAAEEFPDTLTDIMTQIERELALRGVPQHEMAR